MKKRLFIAINLPRETKEEISKIAEEINRRFLHRSQLSSSFRWLPPENWHITLVFLGYQPQENIPAITESIKKAVKNYSHILKDISAAENKKDNNRMLGAGGVRAEANTQMLKIQFEKMIWAPPGKTPRMLWLLGYKDVSARLGVLRDCLNSEFKKLKIDFDAETRPFNAHITLARFDEFKKQAFDFPRIDIKPFVPKYIDLMESHLKRTGALYEIIARVEFCE